MVESEGKRKDEIEQNIKARKRRKERE